MVAVGGYAVNAGPMKRVQLFPCVRRNWPEGPTGAHIASPCAAEVVR